jgi:hypothetical protein
MPTFRQMPIFRQMPTFRCFCAKLCRIAYQLQFQTTKAHIPTKAHVPTMSEYGPLSEHGPLSLARHLSFKTFEGNSIKRFRRATVLQSPKSHCGRCHECNTIYACFVEDDSRGKNKKSGLLCSLCSLCSFHSLCSLLRRHGDLFQSSACRDDDTG